MSIGEELFLVHLRRESFSVDQEDEGEDRCSDPVGKNLNEDRVDAAAPPASFGSNEKTSFSAKKKKGCPAKAAIVVKAKKPNASRRASARLQKKKE